MFIPAKRRSIALAFNRHALGDISSLGTQQKRHTIAKRALARRQSATVTNHHSSKLPAATEHLQTPVRPPFVCLLPSSVPSVRQHCSGTQRICCVVRVLKSRYLCLAYLPRAHATTLGTSFTGVRPLVVVNFFPWKTCLFVVCHFPPSFPVLLSCAISVNAIECVSERERELGAIQQKPFPVPDNATSLNKKL